MADDGERRLCPCLACDHQILLTQRSIRRHLARDRTPLQFSHWLGDSKEEKHRADQEQKSKAFVAAVAVAAAAAAAAAANNQPPTRPRQDPCADAARALVLQLLEKKAVHNDTIASFVTTLIIVKAVMKQFLPTPP
jgi:hypothetical protein